LAMALHGVVSSATMSSSSNELVYSLVVHRVGTNVDVEVDDTAFCTGKRVGDGVVEVVLEANANIVIRVCRNCKASFAS